MKNKSLVIGLTLAAWTVAQTSLMSQTNPNLPVATSSSTISMSSVLRLSSSAALPLSFAMSSMGSLSSSSIGFPYSLAMSSMAQLSSSSIGFPYSLAMSSMAQLSSSSMGFPYSLNLSSIAQLSSSSIQIPISFNFSSMLQMSSSSRLISSSGGLTAIQNPSKAHWDQNGVKWQVQSFVWSIWSIEGIQQFRGKCDNQAMTWPAEIQSGRYFIELQSDRDKQTMQVYLQH